MSNVLEFKRPAKVINGITIPPELVKPLEFAVELGIPVTQDLIDKLIYQLETTLEQKVKDQLLEKKGE